MPLGTKTPLFDPGQQARMARREAARLARRRRRQVAGGAAAAVIVLAALILSGAFSGSTPAPRKPVRPRVVKPAIIPGGPLAPARFGGLAALWAPGNVVGEQPGTAAAYARAARLAGLPGYLLIADRGNNRILIVDPRRRIVFRYPQGGDRKLFFNDDTFVEPGGRALIANEEDNHAIVEIGIYSHALRLLFGHPGQAGSDGTHLNTPDDAYMLPSGTFDVADAYNCRVLFVRGGRIARSIGRAGHCAHHPPQTLGPVNGDTPEPDGSVLISEIPGSWIDEVGPDGRLHFAIRAPVGYPSDPQPLPGKRILLADYSNPGHVVIINHRGRVLWSYGPVAGPGKLDHPSLAMGLPNGDIAVNDDYRQRVVIIDPRMRRIVWQYGHTDVAGTAPGFLNTPDGMDFVPASATGAPDFAAVVHP